MIKRIQCGIDTMFGKIKAEYDFITRSKRKFSSLHPSIFSVEVSLGCNLRCPECKTGNSQINRKKGLMTFAEFQIIADKIKPYAKYVYLHLWGEPLLNNDIFLMIEYISTVSHVNISTNGQLVNKEIAEKLILSGVTDIIVSIDGVTQEVYEKYRVGGNIQKAFGALENLVYYNKKNGKHVNIIPQFIVFKHNEHQIHHFEHICKTLGLVPSFKSPYISKKSHLQRSTYPHYRRKEFSNSHKYSEALSKECMAVQSSLTILIDGSVVPCCYDFQSNIIFGNIFQDDIIDIWNCPECYNFRYNLYMGRTPKFCLNNCLMFYYDGEFPR